ncbi:MAG TPA: PLP-dependent aminotransferase family protein [Chromobacteriaceae bacterium]|nr:PLP-dependent aminotransferase family protein [Chromobacteriaceae bacterium]
MSKSLHLAQLFRYAIEQGHLVRGDRMPSLRKACQDHQVSLTTAQRAYDQLERENYIAAVPRSGFRVLGRPDKPHPALPPADSPISMEHLTTALPMPWGCPFMNSSLINTTPMNKALTQALKDYRTALISHDTDGHDGLRRELALRYLTQGTRLQGEELLITCGCMEALSLAIRAVANVSACRSMLVVTPAFPAIRQQLEQVGLQMVEADCDPEHGLDMAKLEQQIEQHQPGALIVMANFQHPVGRTLPDSQKAALVKLADRHRLAIIEDDTYRELYLGEQAPLPLKAFDQRGTVLHCSSFSKSLAPGYRVGWIAAGRYRDTIRGLKLYSSLGTPLPSQMALARLLASGHQEEMLQRLRHTLRQRLTALQQQLAEHFPVGTRLITPQGGYVMWLELPHGLNTSQLLPMAMQQGIHFAPSPLFYARPDAPVNALRLNFSFYDPLRHGSGIILLAELIKHYLPA